MGASSPIQITIKKNKPMKIAEKTSEKIYNSIVRINDGNDNFLGTGFFVKLNIDDEDYYFLITTNEVITSEHFEGKEKINLYYGKSKNETKLQIGIKNRSQFTFYHPLDIAIIEMLESDNIPKDKFLNADMNYIHGYEIYKEKDLILSGYQQNGNEFEKFISYGEINKIMRKEFEHEIESGIGSFGSPICLNDSLLVIGIHKEKGDNKSFGTFIGEIINELENSRKKNLESEKIYITKYEGSLYRGLRHGKGTGYYSDRSIYEGDRVYDMREGRGIMKYTNGNKYEGDWKNDRREGKGIFYFNNGDYYEGEFKNNRIDGYGTLCAKRNEDTIKFEGTLLIKNFDNEDFDVADFLGHNYN